MTTIEKVCNFIGFFMLLGLASLAEDPKPSFIVTYLLITAFFLRLGVRGESIENNYYSIK